MYVLFSLLSIMIYHTIYVLYFFKKYIYFPIHYLFPNWNTNSMKLWMTLTHTYKVVAQKSLSVNTKEERIGLLNRSVKR